MGEIDRSSPTCDDGDPGIAWCSLALAIPFIGIGVVFWLLLPGGTAAPAFSTAVFRHNAALKPDYWPTRNVTVRGYLLKVDCTKPDCEPMALVSASIGPVTLKGNDTSTGRGSDDRAPAHESGWHGEALRADACSRRCSPLMTHDISRPGPAAGYR